MEMDETNIQALVERFTEFLEDFGYAQKVEVVADNYPDEKSLEVKFRDIEAFSPELAEMLLSHPTEVILAGEQAIKKLIPADEIEGKKIERLYFRVKELPPTTDVRVGVRDIRSKHVGRFISVQGLVRRATEVRPKILDAYFQCQKCNRIIRVPQDSMLLKEPFECYRDQGGCGKPAAATRFKALIENSQLVDTQKLEVQEQPEELRGAQPQRLSAWMEDDIAGVIQVGDRIVLSGVLRTYLGTRGEGAPPDSNCSWT